MSRRPRTPQAEKKGGTYAWFGTCPTCRKRCYPSKADAKAAARQLPHRKGGRLSVYQCGTYWHYGHLPKQIARGDASRDDLGKRGRTRR